jgi:hypothetical protein
MGADWYNFALLYGVKMDFYDFDFHSLMENEEISNWLSRNVDEINRNILVKNSLSCWIYLYSPNVSSRWEGQDADDLKITSAIIGWRCPEFKSASELLEWEKNVKTEELNIVTQLLNLDISDKPEYYNIYIHTI